MRSKYSVILATHFSADAKILYQLNLTKSTAMIFGNEHSGVSDEIMKMTDGNFIIPQVGVIQSLNISVACAISLYEAFRQKNMAGHYDEQKLSPEVFNNLKKEWGVIDENM